jgi:hypothetical protein
MLHVLQHKVDMQACWNHTATVSVQTFDHEFLGRMLKGYLDLANMASSTGGSNRGHGVLRVRMQRQNKGVSMALRHKIQRLHFG